MRRGFRIPSVGYRARARESAFRVNPRTVPPCAAPLAATEHTGTDRTHQGGVYSIPARCRIVRPCLTAQNLAEWRDLLSLGRRGDVIMAANARAMPDQLKRNVPWGNPEKNVPFLKALFDAGTVHVRLARLDVRCC